MTGTETSSTGPTTAPIAARVTGLLAGMAEHVPAEALAALALEREELRTAGIPGGVLPVGSRLPGAELLDAAGRPTTVREATAGRPAVVVFYRGAWCPFCNLALRTYQELLVPELDRRGVALVAISPQRPDGSLTMEETNELTFAVLSDPGNRIASGLGILTAPTPDAREAQLTLGLDVTTVNADGTAALPMPTVVLLEGSAEGGDDQGAVIRWIDVHPDYSTRTEPEQILQAVAAHLG